MNDNMTIAKKVLQGLLEKKGKNEEEGSEEEKAMKAIKYLIETDWGKDNDSQGAASSVFKALSFNDSDIANKFMDDINKYASGLKDKYLK